MNIALVISRLQDAFVLPREQDLAEMLGCTPANVSNWKRTQHIPWKRRAQIEQIAKKRGVTLPAEYRAMVERAA